MKYNQIIKLEDGRECLLRNAAETDGQALLDLFRLAHGETDFLRSYPDEKVYDAVRESAVLKEKSESENEIEMLAEVDGRIVGSAGISAVGSKYKVRHRAEFGISVVKDFWGSRNRTGADSRLYRMRKESRLCSARAECRRRKREGGGDV